MMKLFVLRYWHIAIGPYLQGDVLALQLMVYFLSWIEQEQTGPTQRLAIKSNYISLKLNELMC
jgi:hypothetical protein